MVCLGTEKIGEKRDSEELGKKKIVLLIIKEKQTIS